MEINHFTQSDILQMGRIERANLINSISGIKPANLIGTVSEKGISNLAIFSSVLHLGSNPPLLGMIQRPLTENVGDTYRNLLATGYYTINHVNADMTESAHQTSAKYPTESSEFQNCGFQEAYLFGFPAPFVAESQVKIGMAYRQSIPIELNNTILVIGEIMHIVLPNGTDLLDGQLDLSALGSIGISGLNRYYDLQKIAEYPYAQVNRTAQKHE